MRLLSLRSDPFDSRATLRAMGDVFSGLGDTVGGITQEVGGAMGQLLGGAGGAVRDAGPAAIFLVVAFFAILLWVLRR